MNGLSIIIPSRTESNLKECLRAIREARESCRIICVDDFFSRPGFHHRDPQEPDFVCGEKPFVFSRNMNIGIRAAGMDDVVLLNDDAQLKTPGGFTLLQTAAEENPEFGIIASTTNCVGNTNQYPKSIGLRVDERMVCFVAVLIPRRTINSVGLLDERFVGYGMDDDDYCLRVRNAGLKIGIHDGCFVDHKSLPSSYRGPAGAGGDFRGNHELFKEKWGHDNRGVRV